VTDCGYECFGAVTESPMTARLAALALRSTAPSELARFWAHALRWSINLPDGDDGEAEIVPTDATTFSLVIQRSDGAKVGQNRIHFDLTTTSLDDQNATVTELLDIGAAHIDIGQDRADTHVVLADPEGNEFCIIDPHNRFLETCPRLGAVNCDGSHALGEFWSAALGWPLVWDQDEETAIQADGTGPKITWSGPPLMPRAGVERFHFHIAPTPGTSPLTTLDHLLALGATRHETDHACPGATVLCDVDGNPFCLFDV
jgi:Glyoxalase-like domain